MPAKYSVSSKALIDIENIRNWYDERSDVAGEWFLDELYEYIKKLSVNPEQYRPVNKRARRCSLKRFPHIIFFAIKPTEIVILRIRHINQKPLKRFT